MSTADIVILVLAVGFLIWMIGRSCWYRRRGKRKSCGGCPYAGHCAAQQTPDHSGCQNRHDGQ